MALRNPVVDVNGRLSEMPSGDYIKPATLGAGTPSSNTILDGSGNWVTVSSLNYWTLSGSDVYYNSGNVYIGHSSSLGSYKLQVTGSSYFVGNTTFNSHDFYLRDDSGFLQFYVGEGTMTINPTIYNTPLDGTTTLLKAVDGVITRAVAKDITDMLGTDKYIQNQSASFQSGNFRITGTGIGYGFYAATNTLSGVGYSSLMPGNSTQAGYIEIVSSNKGRLGYIGYDNNNLTYLSEGAANHVFLGNKTLIGSGAVYGTQVFQVTGTSYFSNNIAIAGNIDLIVGANRYIQIGSATNYYYNLQAVNDDFQILEAGTIARITIKYPNGFVGIGTTTPNANLEVSHHIRINSGSNQYGYQLTNDNEGTHFRLRYFANNVVYSNLITGVYTGIIILGNDPSQNGTKTLQINGGIRQNDVISGLVYADSIGQFASASQSHVMSVLGDSAYIKNQSDAIQTGSFRISGQGRLPTLLLDQSYSNSYAELQFRKAGIIQFDLFNYTDANSNLLLTRYDDAGGYTGTVFTVYRNTGNITFNENVGIGGIVPQYRLDVNGIGRFISTILVESSSTAGSSLLRLLQTGSNWWDIENVFPGHLKFSRGGVDHVMFTNYGRLLLGTTSEFTSSILQVNGSITQRSVLAGLIYADGNGEFITAQASHIAATLGAGNYIQNQLSSPQGANSWISGIQRADLYTKSGRYGYYGTYDPTQVQGIWSISENYPVDIVNNTFGYQYGLVYAYDAGTTNVARRPLAGYSHQVLFVGDGLVNAAISIDTGKAYFKGNLGIGISETHSRLHINGYNPRIWVQDPYATNTPYFYQELIANTSIPYMVMQVGDYAAYRNLSLQNLGGKVIIGATSDYGNYKLQVVGDVLLKDSYLHIDGSAPTIGFRDTDSRGAYIHVNSSFFHILRMNDSGTNWQANSSGLWPLYINLENNNAYFGGYIQQEYTKNTLVYANSVGGLVSATAQNVRDLLGTGSYIQNQFTGAQSASAFWVDAGRVGSATTTGNLPTFSVTGQHSTAHMSVYSVGNGTLTASLDLWASEPGLTFDGSGIGNNVNSSPYYGRRNTSLASSYIRFYNGHIFFSSSTTERLNPANSPMILSNTERLLVGYGADVNSYKVQINSGSATDNGLYVNGHIRATGTIIADGYFSGTSSDIRYKSDFKEISVIGVIDKINVVSYKHKLYNDARLIGSVAQEIEEYFPELITKDEKGYLRVDNYGYAALSLQLGKELKSEVDILKDRVRELEKQVDFLSK